MTTRIWWVRHGPTHAKAAIGWTNLPADLSDTKAINRLTEYLPTNANIVSSDLLRASATADAIAASRPRLENDAGLREMNFGDWEGKSFSDIAKDDPNRSREFWENPGQVSPPNGESWNDLSARISRRVDAMLQSNARGDLVIVAHFAVILTALQRASGIDAKAAFSFKIDNLSVTRTDYLRDLDQWRVQCVNHKP